MPVNSSSTSPQNLASEARSPVEAARPSSFAAVPGWVISGMLHAATIVFLITSGLPSCGDQQIGTGADQGEFRDVGIYVKQAGESTERSQNVEPEDSKTDQAASPSPSESLAAQTQEVEETAADLISPPQVKPRSIIGESAAFAPPSNLPGTNEMIVQPSGIKTPQSKGHGAGNVSFMGHTAPAQRVVYVIDSSSSMEGNDAIGFARMKLMESINGLSKEQTFQIINYTLVPHVMKLRGDTKIQLYRADDFNRTLARRHVNTIVADSGTKHMPALRLGLGFNPDVLFFLTDADDPRLSPSDLYEIKQKLNKDGKTHIHSIKFGQGPDLQPATDNFLRTLASENRGSYTYHNVEQLGTRSP